MALTETQKVKIITDLGTTANFESTFSRVNRNWFVRHMIDYYASTGVADTAIRGSVQTFITTCKTIVNSKKNFIIGVPFTAKLLRSKLSRRVEIIYGALAAKPELAVGTNANFLDFIIKRRFRTVMRMDYFVNPNSQGYFRYPHTCSTAIGNQYKVNDDATSFWQSFNSGWNGIFFRLTPPASNPVLNFEKLFILKRISCQGNLLDCARVLSILFMDTLFEASNKNTLLSFLVAKPDTNIPISGGGTSHNSYVGICHPNDLPNSHFITDNTNESLFSKLDIPATDLQVGDHIYIYNHPLYKVFIPNGSWRGEHALVYDLMDRNYKSQNGFMFGEVILKLVEI